MLNTPIVGGPLDCGTTAVPTTCGSGGQMSSGVGVNASVGHGNYNGAFVSLKATNWHGISLQENFTWSKALGTGALVQATSEYTVNDPFDLHNGYGLQAFDRKFVFNTVALIEDPWYKNQPASSDTSQAVGHCRRFCHWQRRDRLAAVQIRAMNQPAKASARLTVQLLHQRKLYSHQSGSGGFGFAPPCWCGTVQHLFQS